jgi:23S rRNA (cytosine1962-C5)-methyltransferase
MRLIQVSKKILNLIESGQVVISKQGLDEIQDRVTPGEWVIIQGSTLKFIVYINPHAEGGLLLRVCYSGKTINEYSDVTQYIREYLSKAKDYRIRILGRTKNCRLFYGAEDGIPGLILDCYDNYLIGEINTFGCWKYKEIISNWCEENISADKILIRTKSTPWETLPVDEDKPFVDTIHIIDNEMRFQIPLERMQKIGYYFDHSRNRKNLEILISNFNQNGQQLRTGLDLFCYVGSWGLSLLKAGLNEVDFVDQGNFHDDIKLNVQSNSFQNLGSFYRSDVFDYLDQAMRMHKKYDVIVSDPPAMTKRPDQKTQALRGYSKIHYGCLKLARKGTIFIAASCTSYISNEELDETVNVSAKKLSLQLRLLQVGMQEWDHPVKGFKVDGNYIKYLCYIVL